MFFFVAYAVYVWYATAVRRRRWQGFAFAAGGLLGVVIVGYAHWLLNIYTEGRINLPVLQSILYPYGLLVFVVSVYIACLPRAVVPGVCHTCGYDLAGLATLAEAAQTTSLCPECGRRSLAAAKEERRGAAGQAPEPPDAAPHPTSPVLSGIR